MTDSFDPRAVRKENLTAVIADALREAIQNGKLQPGQELNQMELAQRFGVSRIPVREALIRLEAEGLVESEPYRSPVVARLTADGLLELLEIRQALELLALEKSVPRMGAADFARLGELLAQAEQPGIDHAAWTALNRTFHAALYEPAGRPRLQALVISVHRNVGRYLQLLGASANRIDQANAEHRAILDACRAGDVEGAKRWLARHIEGTRDALMAAVARREASPASD
jgi:DNA-binding GntR family transcriptional regulator